MNFYLKITIIVFKLIIKIMAQYYYKQFGEKCQIKIINNSFEKPQISYSIMIYGITVIKKKSTRILKITNYVSICY